MKRNPIRTVVTAVLVLLTLLPLTQSALSQAPEADVRAEVPTGEWSDFYYKFIAGSTFRPRESTTWASMGAGGCVYSVDSSNMIFNVPLDLPDGARIDYLRLYYYDANASNCIAWVTHYDGEGHLVDLPSAAGVVSSGTGGYGHVVSSYIGHEVDNVHNAYVLNWRPQAPGNTMALCGMRVAYRLRLQQFYLPLIVRG